MTRLELLLGDQRAELRVGVEPGADLRADGELGEPLDHLVEDRACTNRREPALQAWPELK